MKWVLFVLFLSASLIRAQDQEYIQIYNLIGQADTLKESGQAQAAAARYRDAQIALQKLQTAYPKWNDSIVKFRLQYIAEKLQSLGQTASATNVTPAAAIQNPAAKTVALVDQVRQLQAEKAMLEAKLKEALSIQPNVDRPNELAQLQEQAISLQKERDSLKVALDQQQKSVSERKSDENLDQVRQLQAEKAMLEAKLKEALSVQPNAGRPNELAQLQEQTVSLQKERDLLKVALDQQQKSVSKQKRDGDSDALKKLKQSEQERDELQKKLAAAAAPSTAAPRDGDAERAREVAQLRARLEALEAQPSPYTPEELALFKQPPPQLAPVEAKPVKKSKELPAGAGALVNQAERAFAARRFDEAEKKYLEVLRQDEKNVYILGNLAATQMEMNKTAEVEQNIQRALEIDPEDGFSLTLLGMLRFRQGKFDEALDVLSRAAKIDPQNPETQNYLGITLSQQGQRVAAEAALRKAIKIQPNYAGAHHNLAVIYATQRPPFLELARWHYDRAILLGHSKNPELEKMIAGEK